MKKHNFSAGPSILPQEVFEQAAQAVLNFNDSGLSILEMSHRSSEFVNVMESARSLVKEVLGIPEHYEVLFLQGGASLGFYISALNFLKEKASYINTGSWSKKAIKEARLVGEVDVIASSEDRNFNYIPKNYEVPTYDYLHITSNNTIFGTEFHSFPKTEVPIICDMSSDIFSRPVENISSYDLIYAGAQKNLGPAGTTLYIVNKDKLGKTGRAIPSMLDLGIHISKDSMYNTPPAFAVYVCMLTLEWLKKNGGVESAAMRNKEKANLIYDEIDRNSLFTGTVEKEDRSLMNVTFLLTDMDLEETFANLCKEAGISGIKGHRSVGGYRASIYNAMPKESVQVLVDVMKHLENKFG